MEVATKVKFNASKERTEKFGMNKYIIYLPIPEDEDAVDVIRSVLSRFLGAPLNSVQLKNRNLVSGDFTFHVG